MLIQSNKNNSLAAQVRQPRQGNHIGHLQQADCLARTLLHAETACKRFTTSSGTPPAAMPVFALSTGSLFLQVVHLQLAICNGSHS